jgi:hypothetical protein
MPTDREPNIHLQIEAHGNLDCAHWPDGPFCPHCGEREAIRVIHEQTSRPGIYRCLRCRKRFAGVLEILFQADSVHRDPRSGTTRLSRLWVWVCARTYRGPTEGLTGIAVYSLWYGVHIIRQVLVSSDPKPRG